MRDEIAGGDEDEHADDERDGVERGEGRQMDLHGCFGHVVGGGVEADDARGLLQDDECCCGDVAEEHAAADDEDGKPEERVAYGGVRRAEGFQCAYHLCAFEDDDEQTAYHREACNAHHEYQNNPYVHVEQ